MKEKNVIKGLVILSLLVAIILVFPNTVKAAVEYTRTITGNDGSIGLNLTGLSLDESKGYSFALTLRGGVPEEWHNITEYTESTAKINLSASTNDLCDVLKATDTGVLYIKDNQEEERNICS